MPLLTSHCSFNIDDLVVHFPYDKIYPEQYQYMCDLKKALDAQVRVLPHSNRCCAAMTIILKLDYIGTLCTRNAFGYGQDGLFAFAYCCISNGEHLHYSATGSLCPRSTQCGYVSFSNILKTIANSFIVHGRCQRSRKRLQSFGN